MVWGLVYPDLNAFQLIAGWQAKIGGIVRISAP